MSEMADMSRAIRTTLERHGPTLKEVPTDALEQYVQITGAFYLDMKDELAKRQDLRPPEPMHARQCLGVED